MINSTNNSHMYEFVSVYFIVSEMVRCEMLGVWYDGDPKMSVRF